MDSGVVVVITTSLAIILVAFVIPVGFLLWRQRTSPDEQRRTLRRAVGLLFTTIVLITLIAIWTYVSLE